MADNEKDLEYGNDLLTLVDDEGVEHEFEVVDTLEIEDEQYMALIPVYDDPQKTLDDDGELVILRVVQDDEGEYLEPIEDEDQFNKISDLFIERLEQYYNIEN